MEKAEQSTAEVLSLGAPAKGESAELVPDALCRGGDGGLVRDVELEGTGIRSDALRGRLPMLEVARPDEHGGTVRREILRDLKTDSFVSPRDQGDGLVVHSNLLSLFRRVPLVQGWE
jgi:hypothetical protein